MSERVSKEVLQLAADDPSQGLYYEMARELLALRSQAGEPDSYDPEYLYHVAENTLIPTDSKKKQALFDLIHALEQPDNPAQERRQGNSSLHGKPLDENGAIAFAAAPPSQPGAVSVPREPTEEMLEAGIGPFLGAHDLMFCKNEPCGPIWKAMWDAAPRQPEAQPTLGIEHSGYGDEDERWADTVEEYVTQAADDHDYDDLISGDPFYIDHFWVRHEQWRTVSTSPIVCERVDAITVARPAEDEAKRQDADRYRYMRSHTRYEYRNGPGIYWYLPRWDNELPDSERLDKAIDAALAQQNTADAPDSRKVRAQNQTGEGS